MNNNFNRSAPALVRARLTGLLLAAALSGGCASTLCIQSKRNPRPVSADFLLVYVTNPELEREYQILRLSGIYCLTSNLEKATHLTLKPLQQLGRCANPLLLSAVSLGIIPGWLPGNYSFEYTLEENGEFRHRRHYLPVYERISIWEWLIRQNDEEVLAEALAQSDME